MLHFWAFLWYMRRGFREMSAAQVRIAEMLREIRDR
jgi:hypothetical protein